MSIPNSKTGGYRHAWADRRFRVHVLLTAVALPLALMALSVFLLGIEERSGVVLDDPVLALIPPTDASVPTFALIYGGILVGVASLARAPWRLVCAVQGYVLLVLLRMLCMWVTPLDPPVGFVPLHDPVVESLGPATALTRDLFFSGHTSTLFLLSLSAPSRGARIALCIATLAVAFLLLLQHAHYAVDVFVAPLAAFCSFALARRLSSSRRRVSG